jgi:hypothetical protein
MEAVDDTIAELEAVTAEMAGMQDLAGKRLSDLLEKRGMLIRRLIANGFDAGDSRLMSIIADAERLQERLKRHADSIRRDLAGLETAGRLLTAVGSTLSTQQPKSLDISA